MHKLIRITTVPISLDKLLGKQLTYMNRHFLLTAVSAEEEKLRKVAEKYGVDHHHIEMTRKITPLLDLRAVWNLYIYFRKEKPKVVHTHTPKAGIVGMLAAKLAGIPVRMHTVAGMPLMETSGFKRKLLSIIEILTYKCATKVYPNSHGLHRFVLENKFTSDKKLKVIGNGSSNGIDTTYFSAGHFTAASNTQLRINLEISETDFVFIFVGRIVSHKGINELVKAFVALQNSSFMDQSHSSQSAGTELSHDESPTEPASRLKILLVGEQEPKLDPLEPEILSEIYSNPDIVSVGYQQDVRPYMAIASALCFPSYREGFPNVVMQAGAMGLPAIVTDINGCNEIIIEGKNGTVIPPKNTGALTQAMHRMYTDSQWREVLQKNARKMITERYEQHVVWDALLAEYNSQLEKAGFCRTEAIVL